MNMNNIGFNTKVKVRALAAAMAVFVMVWSAPLHDQGVSTPRRGPAGREAGDEPVRDRHPTTLANARGASGS